MSIFKRMIKGVQRIFSNEEQDEIKEDSSEYRQESRMVSNQDQPKVIYQYPKQGKFRFPLIEDDEKVRQSTRSDERDREQLRVRREDRQQSESTNKQVKWFTNEDFKRTEVPPPAYKLKVQKQEEWEDTQIQEEIEVVFEQLNIQNDEQIEIVDEVEEKTFIEEEELVDEIEEDVHEIEEFHEIEKVEEQQDEQVLEEKHVKVEEPSVQVNEEVTDKEVVIPEGKKSDRKTVVPFNVLMLADDRKKQRTTKSEEEAPRKKYSFPTIQLLDYPKVKEEDDSAWLKEQANILEEALQSFHVDAKVVHTTKGPSVTRFEIQPGRGVKVNKVTSLTDDIKLALAAKDIRIEAPIPGKNTIGIEVPNRTATPVFLREILRRDLFIRAKSPLTVALGLDISGQPVVTDLQKMPHGLVAGATGSGKSVCINSVLVSLLYKASPDEVKFILIDPKMVELAPYNDVPHLVTPVITDAKQATAALKWVVEEMERRYELFSENGVRDVARYNELYSESKEKPAMPYILVVIDELADLMMVSPQEVEDAICRIAQKARACGIHLLLATQRPSVDVITGLIKANIPTRIAFSVSSQTDSRTILDMGGAERLLGRGDMLFHENGMPKPVRVQGTFVSDEEIENVIAHVKKQREPQYLLQKEQLKKATHMNEVDDEYFEEACYFVIEQGSASASSIQRRFRVGYNRAARLIDQMEEKGIISQAMGSKPRHVLVDQIELEELLYHKS